RRKLRRVPVRVKDLPWRPKTPIPPANRRDRWRLLTYSSRAMAHEAATSARVVRLPHSRGGTVGTRDVPVAIRVVATVLGIATFRRILGRQFGLALGQGHVEQGGIIGTGDRASNVVSLTATDVSTWPWEIP